MWNKNSHYQFWNNTTILFQAYLELVILNLWWLIPLGEGLQAVGQSNHMWVSK